MVAKRTRDTQKPAADAPWLLGIQFKRLDELQPDPRNARTHTDVQLGLIAESLREFGWASPLGEAGGLLTFGHGRLAAAKRLRDAGVHIAGTPSPDMAPVVDLSRLSADQRKALALADNRLSELAGWDAALLAEQLGELTAVHFDIESIGFTADDLAGPEGHPSVAETPVSRVEDRFWISVRGPLPSQAAALQALLDVMARVDGVTVELGTVLDDG
jgi:hypothetical protein